MNKGKKFGIALLLVMAGSQVACLGGGQAEVEQEEEIFADQAPDMKPEDMEKKAALNAQALTEDLSTDVAATTDEGTTEVVAIDPDSLNEDTATAGVPESGN